MTHICNEHFPWSVFEFIMFTFCAAPFLLCRPEEFYLLISRESGKWMKRRVVLLNNGFDLWRCRFWVGILPGVAARAGGYVRTRVIPWPDLTVPGDCFMTIRTTKGGVEKKWLWRKWPQGGMAELYLRQGIDFKGNHTISAQTPWWTVVQRWVRCTDTSGC